MPVEDLVIDDTQAIDQQQAGDTQQVADDTQAIDDTQQQVATDPVAGDERTLPRWIRDLKATRPQDFAAAKDAFFGQKTLQDKLKDFDLDGTKNWLSEVGGRETLETRLQELDSKAQEFDGLMQDVQSGNVTIADRIFETAGAKAPEIARAMMTQWAQKDFDSYSDALTPVFAATIMNGQTLGLDGKTPTTIPHLLAEARYASQYAPPEQQQAIAQGLIERMQQFIGGFANAQPKAAAAPNQQRLSELDQREKSINERDQQQFVGTVASSLREGLQKEAETALATYFSRRPEDKDAKELATTNVMREVNDRLAKDADFNKKWDAFISRKDKEGALKLAASRQKSIIGEIAARVGRTIFGNPTQKVTPPVQQRQQTVRSQVVVPSDPKKALLGEIFSR